MKTNRSITRFVFEKKPAVFRSQFGLQESVQRLSGQVKRNSWQTLFRDSLVGRVQENDVLIMRVIPLAYNSYTPVFHGQFLVRDGITVLDGYFAMAKSVRVLMGFWYGFMLFTAFLFPLTALSDRPMPEWQAQIAMAVGPSIILVFGVLTMMLGKWRGRKDAAVISARIENALNR